MWILPSDFSACAQEPTDSASPSESLCQTLSQSLMSRSKRMPAKFWRRAWTKRPWIRRLSGRMPEPSLADAGVERWIASWRDTPASHSQPPASDVVPMIRAIYGPALLASLKKWHRHCAFSRTCQDTFLWGSERSASTWSKWITKWRRACLRRRKWAIRTSAIGCSSWPTPNAMNSQEGESPATWLARRETLKEKGINGNGAGTPLAMAVQCWATPNSMLGGSVSRGGDRVNEPLLAGQAQQWATPNARDHKGSDLPSRNGGASLSHQVETGVMSHSARQDPPTPTAGDSCSVAGLNLLQQWNTPRAEHDSGKHRGESDTLHSQVKTLEPAKKLNPLFVTWLMGLPPQWNIVSMPCGQAEMESFLSRQRTRLFACLALLSEGAHA
jgi:hypothetical protein